MPHPRLALCVLLLLALLPVGPARAEKWSAEEAVTNPVNLTFTNALVRLKTQPPEELRPGSLGVSVDGQPVPHQVDADGRVWVAATLKPMESVAYTISNQPTKDWPDAEIDPGLLKVLDPMLGDAEPIAKGPLFRRYRLDQGAGVTVTLQPGKPYAVIEQSATPDKPLQSRFELTRTVDNPFGAMRRWYSGPFQAAGGMEALPLDNSKTRVPGAIIELLPRWTQSYDDAWFFGVANKHKRMVGVLPVRAGQWRWPHEAKLVIRAEDGKAYLNTDMRRGRNRFLIIAGQEDKLPPLTDIVRTEGFSPLDKLHNDYVFGPIKPGDKPARVMDFYSNQTNPTDMIRRWSRAAIKDVNAGKTRSSLHAVYEAQARLDPDWYGRYEHGWSPINPNFYTDFTKLAILQAAMLRGHPAFEHVRRQAEDAMRADLEHSVTLPGGAGQECPGYQAHAAHQWAKLRPIAKKHLGFDPAQWPQWKATGRFILHSSPPAGGGKRAFHPGGDTHPGRGDPAGFAKQFGYSADPRKFVTEELPGFGVIFRHNPGTPVSETYLAFKAGPNRGHYHGDQLSLHLCFSSKPAAVDHHCSYKPRAGQEHMHNRLSFSADGMPYANMDGHERLIAFKTSDAVDAAVAQVESPRLRATKELPPEDWDDALATQWFDTPLTYRRTIVFVKNSSDGKLPIHPYFVIHDRYTGPELDATYNLHMLGNSLKQNGNAFSNSKMTLHVAMPDKFEHDLLKWEHDNGGLEQTVSPRITQRGQRMDFITLLFQGDNPPKVESIPGGVRVGDTEVTFDVSEPKAVALVTTAGKPVLELDAEKDIDLNRSQGEVGLFVPDVGYPFGPIPDWLIEQRGQRIQ